jgi:hypothetical protein
MADMEMLSEGPLWFQVGAETSPLRRRVKVLWQWIKEPLVFASIFRTSYLVWWGVTTATLAVMAVAASAVGGWQTVGVGTWWLLLSAAGLWALAYGLLVMAGERYFARREVQLVLESRPEKPAGPNPLFITAYPAIPVGLLMIASWLGLEPTSMTCACLAVWIGAGLILWGGSTYAISPPWLTIPAALALPVTVSALARNLAIMNAGGNAVPREVLSILAPILTLAFMGFLNWRMSVIRDANVRAWQELHNLLPKLATAATAGVLDVHYGPGQLVVDLRRVNTPVELIRPVCILIGTVIMLYRPYFHFVERVEAGAEMPGPPVELMSLTVMDQRGVLRDPWRWFLPAPGRKQ